MLFYFKLSNFLKEVKSKVSHLTKDDFFKLLDSFKIFMRIIIIVYENWKGW